MVKFNHMKLIKDNRGVVPLLTSIFLGVLLSIIAVAFIRLAISERRQATDDDLTTAAFYAAESGLEDARRAIKEFVLNASYTDTQLNGDECTSATGTDSTLGGTTLDASYSCQLIDLTPESLVAKPGAGNSHLFKLDAVNSGTDVPASMNRIVVQWNDQDNDGERNARPSADTANLDVGDWTSSANNYPAQLRLNLFAVARSGVQFSHIRDAGESVTGFINPVNVAPTVHRLTVQDFDSELLQGGCNNPGSSFTCSVEIDLSNDPAIPNSGQDYWLRDIPTRYTSTAWIVYMEVQTLYQSDTVQVEVFNGSTQRSLQGAQARIDVTGQSGDSFRRIETFVPLEGSGELSLPDGLSVVGGDRICKDFFVTDVASEFTILNPALTGSCRNSSSITPPSTSSY